MVANTFHVEIVLPIVKWELMSVIMLNVVRTLSEHPA